MHVSAKVDYGMRALLTLADSYSNGGLVKGESIATAQQIPAKFMEGILGQLRAGGLIVSQRGAVGGYRLARDPSEITVAHVIRALDGPLADVRGERPEVIDYSGPATHLREVWVAVRAALRSVVEQVTLADIVAGEFPAPVAARLAEPGAWERR